MTGARLLVTSLLHLFSYRAAGERGVKSWRFYCFITLLSAGRPTCSHTASQTRSKIKLKIIIRIVYLHCSSCPLRHSPGGAAWLLSIFGHYRVVRCVRKETRILMSQLSSRLETGPNGCLSHTVSHWWGEARNGRAECGIVWRYVSDLISVRITQECSWLLQDFMVAGGVLGGRQGWRGQ